MTEEINEFYSKLDAEVRADYQKKVNSAQIELDKIRQKNKIKESEEERKKRVCEQVSIGTGGSLTIRTLNTYEMTFERVFSNFRKPLLIELRNFLNEHERMYSLQFYIGEKQVEIILEGSKIGNPRYFIHKLTAEGAVIYGEKDEVVKKYAQKLWLFLRNECSQQIWIPEHHGWYTDENGNISFWKEEQATWMEAKKLAL